MTMKRLKRIFTGTLPLFLLLWAGMMGILWGLSGQKLKGEVQLAVQSACQNAESYYQSVWSGEATDARKPAILAGWLEHKLYPYDGVIQFRFYTADGQELARSQLANSRASLPGTGVYDWHLWLDPVLSSEEQLELAQQLQKDPELSRFFGTVGNLVSEEETDERWCDVVGVADEERQVLYPKTITYVYADQEITLVDTDSSFFDGKELTTMRFEGVNLYSALVGSSASPQELLDQWQEVEQEVDLLFSGLDYLPHPFASASVSSNTACYPLSDGTLFGYGFSYIPTHRIIEELKSTALYTLLAAIAMALFTDHRQRRAIQRERDFARAAAHELKTPLAVLRAHAEALREDIAPEKRDQYLDVVLSESDRMSALVGSLLELARTEANGAAKKEPVDLAALVRKVFAPLALPLEQKNLQLQLSWRRYPSPGTGHGWRRRWKIWPLTPCAMPIPAEPYRSLWKSWAIAPASPCTTTGPTSRPRTCPGSGSPSTAPIPPAAGTAAAPVWGWPSFGRPWRPTAAGVGRKTALAAWPLFWNCR